MGWIFRSEVLEVLMLKRMKGMPQKMEGTQMTMRARTPWMRWVEMKFELEGMTLEMKRKKTRKLLIESLKLAKARRRMVLMTETDRSMWLAEAMRWS